MKKLFLYIIETSSQRSRLAGLTPAEWLIRGAAAIPHRVIREEGDAVLPAGYDYLAILTDATPLVRAEDLTNLVEEMEKRGVEGMEIGGGSLRRMTAVQRGARPKRKCASPFAEEIKDAATKHKIERILYRRNAEKSVQNGAIIPDVDSVLIDALSRVEEGVIIEPYCRITGSIVHRGARVGAFSEIENAEIGIGAEISRSVIKDSVIGERATVGPFAYIRMQSEIGEGCRIGDFVEVKRSRIDAGAKAAHLAYIGDASVGEKSNIGCGTVFANYDGKEKHKTTVGKTVFIGANTNLVAPVTVGDGAYIAAATTVTKDIPQGAFVIGRVRAEQKEKKRD